MLNHEEQKHLSWARAVSAEYKKREQELVDVLIESDRLRIFKKLNCPSLFKFAVDVLGLSEAISHALITIARKTKEIPQLRNSGVSASKLSKMVSIMTPDNHVELLEFARNHTARQIEAEVVRRNPKASIMDRIVPRDAETVTLTLTLPKAVVEQLKRVEEIEAQKNQNGLANAIGAAVEIYLFHKDPVRKANRNVNRWPNSVKDQPGKRKVRAFAKHQVNRRDQGRCTHVNEQGERCEQGRWVHMHHIVPLHAGGSNSPENLTTLCFFHHGQEH